MPIMYPRTPQINDTVIEEHDEEDELHDESRQIDNLAYADNFNDENSAVGLSSSSDSASCHSTDSDEEIKLR